MSEDISAVKKILGLKKTGSTRNQTSQREYLHIARRGIPKSNLEVVRKNTGLGVQQLSRVLHITPRALQKKSAVDLLDSYVSEKLLELGRLFARGKEVFGDTKLFSEWLGSPCRALGNEVPLSLLDTSFGFEMVTLELGRIEHGIIA